MTFDAYENSLYSGAPVNFYKFTRSGYSWYYNSTQSDITANGETWKGAGIPISDQGFSQSGSKDNDSIDITMPNNQDVPMLFSMSPPCTTTYVTLFQAHMTDPDFQLISMWQGTLRSVNLDKMGQAVLTCASLVSSLEHDGVRLCWGRECSVALYDPNTCRLDKADFAETGTVISVAASGINAAVFSGRPDGRYANGIVEWAATDGTTESRGIITHVGNQVTIIGFTNTLVAGAAITVYPGCAHNPDDCDGYFNNMANYGGVDQMSGRSVFDGDPVF